MKHSNVGEAASAAAAAQSEGDKEKELGQNLKLAFAQLRQIDANLIELRKPVAKEEAKIKGVYDVLEKQGIDRDLAKFLYTQKRKNRFTQPNLHILNAYSKALGEEDLPLFHVAGTAH